MTQVNRNFLEGLFNHMVEMLVEYQDPSRPGFPRDPQSQEVQDEAATEILFSLVTGQVEFLKDEEKVLLKNFLNNQIEELEGWSEEDEEIKLTVGFYKVLLPTLG